MKGKLQRIGQILEASVGKFVEIRGELNGVKVVHNSFVQKVAKHSPFLRKDGERGYEYEATFCSEPGKVGDVIGAYKKGIIYGKGYDLKVKKIWAITVLV